MEPAEELLPRDERPGVGIDDRFSNPMSCLGSVQTISCFGLNDGVARLVPRLVDEG